MDGKQIIMTFSRPPGLGELEEIAQSILEGLPDELLEYSEDLVIQVEDFPDDATQSDLSVDDAYDLLAFYKSGSEVVPGVEKKESNDDDTLTLYRRPILDLWCENCEDLTILVREVMIEEIAKNYDFAEDEIEEMSARHHQGML